MAARLKIFWLIALCFFVASCSTFSPVGMPLSCDPESAADETEADSIEPGEMVRVTLRDGESITGTFVYCNSICLTIDDATSTIELEDSETGQAKPVEYARRTVPHSEVQTVERRKTSTMGHILTAGAVIGYAAVVYVALLAIELDSKYGN